MSSFLISLSIFLPDRNIPRPPLSSFWRSWRFGGQKIFSAAGVLTGGFRHIPNDHSAGEDTSGTKEERQEIHNAT
jgi:hypothetical protein